MCCMSSVSYLHQGPPPPSGPVGERIAQARGYRRFTQTQLIAAMGALGEAPSRRTLGKWENGETHPTVPDLLLIARVTEFPVAWFVLGLDGSEPTPAGPDDPAEQESGSFTWMPSNVVALSDRMVA